MKSLRFLLLLCVPLILLSCAALFFLNQQAQGLGGTLREKAFNEYVSEVYLPAVKRTSGKWPQNLDNLAPFVKLEPDYTPTNERLTTVINYYKEKNVTMKVLKSSAEAQSYVLLWDNKQRIECKSTVNPDDGNCIY